MSIVDDNAPGEWPCKTAGRVLCSNVAKQTVTTLVSYALQNAQAEFEGPYYEQNGNEEESANPSKANNTRTNSSMRLPFNSSQIGASNRNLSLNRPSTDAETLKSTTNQNIVPIFPSDSDHRSQHHHAHHQHIHRHQSVDTDYESDEDLEVPSAPGLDEEKREEYYFDEQGLPIMYRLLKRMTRQLFWQKTQWGIKKGDTDPNESPASASELARMDGDDGAKSLMTPSNSTSSLNSMSSDNSSIASGAPNLANHIPLIPDALVPAAAISRLIRDVSALMEKEPNLVCIDAPVTIFGDLHGQFIDLLNAAFHSKDFDESGKLKSKWLLLGDFVDRGVHSIEILVYLFALKLRYPDSVYLLRGNHESRAMTYKVYQEGVSFSQECEVKYNFKMYSAFMECFDKMPVAAVVTVPASDVVKEPTKFFCSHAGISPGLRKLDQVDKIDRYREPPLAGPFCDLLWSDPLPEVGVKTMNNEKYDAFMKQRYQRNEVRGCSWMIGFSLLDEFLKENGLCGVIRGHQVAKNGVSQQYIKTREQSYRYPLMTTVFSAPNYCGQYTNRGAIIKITQSADMLVYRFTRPTEDIEPEKSPSVKKSSELSEEFIAGQFARASSSKSEALAELHPGWVSLRATVKIMIKIMRKIANARLEAAYGMSAEEEEDLFLATSLSKSLGKSYGTGGRSGAMAMESFMSSRNKVQSTSARSLSSEGGDLVRVNSQLIVQQMSSVVSHADREQLRYVFGALDRNKDGILDCDELGDFVTALKTLSAEEEVRGRDHDDLDTLLESLQTNDVQTVSFEEFVLWAEAETDK
eukprot:CAMPEP_0184694502 /NCGR_PEP_ID=MMETSP0313-20130426/2434_1 /TAXON_ID=2792 /ORGANISM="Porphyridium aerugineum, Strain SAG 1380-2" /LENGTH=805 /DNA_ID=CAMNT_0027152797 /DNA_START=321 /DNA_END=2738 /DNA_ORIENTATION=+